MFRVLRCAALAAIAVAQIGAAPVPFTATPKPIDLPGDRLHPESVSITTDGFAYVGSMTGGVLRVFMRTGKVEPWIAPGAFGSGALYGVLADRRNGLLWTCTNEFPGTAVTVAGADPGHWLKGFDLRTGKGKVSLQLPGGAAVCNDMAVGKDGSVYIADTGQPRILRWRPGASAFEVWAEDPIFGPEPKHGGLDGIALGGDGALYINNVRSGALYRVEIRKDGKSGAITQLTPSRPLSRPDGMRPLGGLDFVVVEGEGRIDRLSVKGDKVEVTTLAEGITGPTGVDVFDGRAWYVQGQLRPLFRPAEAKAELPFRLTPVALHP